MNSYNKAFVEHQHLLATYKVSTNNTI